MISTNSISGLEDYVRDSSYAQLPESTGAQTQVAPSVPLENKQVADEFVKSAEGDTDDYKKKIVDSNIKQTGDNQEQIKKQIKDKFNRGGEEEDKKKSINGKELTEEDKKNIENLEKVDRNVKNHENAHKTAGGGLARGGATYSYTTGPDGKRYAIGGEVSIDMSYDLKNPSETIAKMQTVKRAALAPADPSSQDRNVASKASAIEAEARAELSKQLRSGLEKELQSGSLSKRDSDVKGADLKKNKADLHIDKYM